MQRALFVDEGSKTTLGFGVRETLTAVTARVLELQAQYNATYDQVLQAMRAAKIRILNEREYSPAQREFASNYFTQRIRTHLVPIMISENRPFPDLNDGHYGANPQCRWRQRDVLRRACLAFALLRHFE